jgi:thermostable 8-oxoguanine DNA glycosylase
MVTASQIRGYRRKSDDYKLTQELKAKFAKLRAERDPFFLTLCEFEKILKWKLGKQYGRQEALRKANTEEMIKAATGAAFGVSCGNKDYETELRLALLCTLRGVGVPVASAVLALVLPEEYAVIDFRGWWQVFGEKRQAFSVSDYTRYLEKLRPLAGELGWAIQEVDLAIWAYDAETRKKQASRPR